jgi:hypothetical protein
MFFSRPIQWYHSHVDPIWPDGTFNIAFLGPLNHTLVTGTPSRGLPLPSNPRPLSPKRRTRMKITLLWWWGRPPRPLSSPGRPRRRPPSPRRRPRRRCDPRRQPQRCRHRCRRRPRLLRPSAGIKILFHLCSSFWSLFKSK